LEPDLTCQQFFHAQKKHFMTKQVLVVESRLSTAQRVKKTLESNGYACCHILGPAEPQIVKQSLLALDTSKERIEITLAEYPVAIIDWDFGESPPGQEMIRALNSGGVTCLTFRFSRGAPDLGAFEDFVHDNLDRIFALASTREGLLGKWVKAVLRFFWRGFERLIR
jgi:hypothetical protein